MRLSVHIICSTPSTDRHFRKVYLHVYLPLFLSSIHQVSVNWAVTNDNYFYMCITFIVNNITYAYNRRCSIRKWIRSFLPTQSLVNLSFKCTCAPRKIRNNITCRRSQTISLYNPIDYRQFTLYNYRQWSYLPATGNLLVKCFFFYLKCYNTVGLLLSWYYTCTRCNYTSTCGPLLLSSGVTCMSVVKDKYMITSARVL